MTKPFLSLLFLSLILSSCRGGGKKVENDAPQVDTVIIINDVPEALPDTVYPSAQLLNVTIRVLDSITAPEIASYADPYTECPGIMTFRANHLRNADMKGRIMRNPSVINIDWVFTTANDERETDFGKWGGGTGWTGQPVYIEWPESQLQGMQKYLNPGFSGKEIIVGSLASEIYFIDFETGQPSRPPLYVLNPIKGTVSLDPSLNGNLYVGQGVPAERPLGAAVIDLNKHEISHFFPEDIYAPRGWGAYDSSPVRVGQFLFRPGENGVLYKFTVTPGGLKLHSTMSYLVSGVAPGIEASMAVYRNYGYTADNHGYVICTNLDTMQPVWVYASGDDNDATPVILVEDDHPYVICSSEIDRQGIGSARIAKLDGLTGEPVWERNLPGERCDRDGKHFDGGFYASPLPGLGNCSHLLFSNVVYNNNGQNGSFIALDSNTGATVYEVPTSTYAWSSPVGFLDPDDRMYVLTGDCIGNIYLIDGIDGTVVAKRKVGYNFESSPVVTGNSAVVGSRINGIYKLSIE